MEKLVQGKKYTAKQLDKLCSLNNIPYYKTLDMKSQAKALNALNDKLKTNIQFILLTCPPPHFRSK